MGTKEKTSWRKDSRDLKKGSPKNYFYVGMGNSSQKILHMFGCVKCSWINTIMCPHGKAHGESHTNGICSERARYIREEIVKVHNIPRLVQEDTALQLKLMSETMLASWGDNGVLDEEYKHTVKNLISLVDKMRRQDEGIKLQNDVNVSINDFRSIVEAQAELVKGKDIIKEAELIDNQPDNERREDTSREQV